MSARSRAKPVEPDQERSRRRGLRSPVREAGQRRVDPVRTYDVRTAGALSGKWYPVVTMRGHFICNSGALFAFVIDRMRQREVALRSCAIYRGQLSSGWLLQSLWERRFLHPQRAGLMEPYYVQPHESAKISLQRAFLECTESE